jgi:hypothetical protein
MVEFVALPTGGQYVADGHGQAEKDLRDGLAATLGDVQQANTAVLAEAWYSDVHGFGHDCTQHQDVDQSMWAPGCHDGGFRPVTVATVWSAPGGVRRANG